MNNSFFGLRRFFFCSLFVFCLLPKAKAEIDEPVKHGTVLVVSSYNPDASLVSSNIDAFIEELTALGYRNRVVIENMSCRSFGEAHKWRNRLGELLTANYRQYGPASAIVLIGQEAWASYLSMNAQLRSKPPVLGALVSTNMVRLPTDSVPPTWRPDAVDVCRDVLPNTDNCCSAFAYHYDVEGTTDMLLSLYPQTKYVAFISDNSYGGVAMQSLVRKVYAEKYPNLDLILLDGREHTIYSVIDQLHELPDNSAILIGTWRMDKFDGFFMKNATYAMMEAAPNVPAFTLSSLGFDYWAIGGVVPQYRNIGRQLAHKVVQVLGKPQCVTELSETIESYPTIDLKTATRMQIDLAPLDVDYRLINQPTSFYTTYKFEIWLVAGFIFLLTIALCFLYFLYRNTKRMRDSLEISENELRAAKNNAEEASNLKSIFLANMSHEIRTPLNAIMGFSQLIADDEVETEADLKHFLKLIISNSESLLRLIDDILDVTRLETNHMKFYYEDIDVCELGRGLIEAQNVSTSNGNKYVFAPAQKQMMLNTDMVRLQQVINNLLSNAEKFTQRGTITLSVEPEDSRLIFAVTDTGCGIPPEKRSKIFERFEKLDEYKQGTGLGLAICKLTIEKFGGHIWLDKDYTAGSKFVFEIPVG